VENLVQIGSWGSSGEMCKLVNIILLLQAAHQHGVNGDCLEIGKWQNSTRQRIKTPKLIAKNCHRLLGRRGDPLCQIWWRSVHEGLLGK